MGNILSKIISSPLFDVGDSLHFFVLNNSRSRMHDIESDFKNFSRHLAKLIGKHFHPCNGVRKI